MHDNHTFDTNHPSYHFRRQGTAHVGSGCRCVSIRYDEKRAARQREYLLARTGDMSRLRGPHSLGERHGTRVRGALELECLDPELEVGHDLSSYGSVARLVITEVTLLISCRDTRMDRELQNNDIYMILNHLYYQTTKHLINDQKTKNQRASITVTMCDVCMDRCIR